MDGEWWFDYNCNESSFSLINHVINEYTEIVQIIEIANNKNWFTANNNHNWIQQPTTIKKTVAIVSKFIK